MRESMVSVFEECKLLGYDFIKEYQENKKSFNINGQVPYTYMDGEVYLQAWGRKMTGETRLWTMGGVKVYDCLEWRRRFNYHNFYRAHVVNHITYAKPLRGPNTYDGCSDCILEIHIINDYLKTRPSISFKEIREKIDSVTFYDLKEHPMNITHPCKLVKYVDSKDTTHTFKASLNSYLR